MGAARVGQRDVLTLSKLGLSRERCFPLTLMFDPEERVMGPALLPQNTQLTIVVRLATIPPSW